MKIKYCILILILSRIILVNEVVAKRENDECSEFVEDILSILAKELTRPDLSEQDKAWYTEEVERIQKLRTSMADCEVKKNLRLPDRST